MSIFKEQNISSLTILSKILLGFISPHIKVIYLEQTVQLEIGSFGLPSHALDLIMPLLDDLWIAVLKKQTVGA